MVLGFANFIKVSAQDSSLTQQQINQITGNCMTLKINLNQLHASDTLLRVNMGQRYELLSTKLMDRFNSRVINNNFKINGLNTSASSYKSALESFRADYIIYEESLAAAIKVDCVSSPNLFYNSIGLARTNRNRVYGDIKNLNRQIDDYRTEVSNFEKSFAAGEAR